MRVILWTRILCGLSLLVYAEAQNANEIQSTRLINNSTSSENAIKSPATCRSGTINYITHTLPQQCLTSSRPVSISVTSTATALAGKDPEPDSQRASTGSPSAPSLSENATVTGHVFEKSQDAASASSVAITEKEHGSITTGITHTQPPSETSTPTSVHSTVTTSVDGAVDTEIDTDSPLDNANFLSFEEWKKQNLAKAGQSPDHVGQQRSSGENKGRTRPGINNALDVLGEDTEIELDFSGFGSPSMPDPPFVDGTSTSEGQKSGSESVNLEKAPSGAALRSKDAGKTCKERTNYASFDCAATVVKSNRECKSASSVLIENKDSYMLNTCSVSNKFFIVELCDDILIDTVVLANYEFFSSIFRTFRLSVSDRYPVKSDRWKDLGVFEARNTRNIQAFLVEQPLIWARYLRIEFLSHYGNEYYCPVSLLRVHGTTMMEEFRHQEDVARGEYPEDIVEAEGTTSTATLAEEPAASSQEVNPSVIESKNPIESPSASSIVEPKIEAADVEPVSSAREPASTPPLPSNNASPGSLQDTQSKSASYTQIETCDVVVNPALEASIVQSKHDQTTSTTLNSSMESSKSPATSISSAAISAAVTDNTIVSNASKLTKANTTVHTMSPSDSSASPPVNTTDPIREGQVPVAPPNIKQHQAAANDNSTPTVESGKIGTASTQASQAMPTTQESFFKSIHKRLQMLESNATLSLQYIEEQSRILRDAFSKVEKRQIRKTETFLDNLNATVRAELQAFGQQYDQLWQSTVIELETHREQYQREMLAVSARLSVVAEELLFQKRMVIVQSTLLMLCLGFVLFARAGNSTLELPLIQQMVNKSYLTRVPSFYSPPNSPSPDQSSPPSTTTRRRAYRSKQKGGHISEGPFDDDSGARNGPELQFQPPTPTSQGAQSDISDDDKEEEDFEDMSESQPHETQSGPATPTGTRDGPSIPHEGNEAWSIAPSLLAPD